MGNRLKKPTARARRLTLHKQLRLSPAAQGQGVKFAVLGVRSPIYRTKSLSVL